MGVGGRPVLGLAAAVRPSRSSRRRALPRVPWASLRWPSATALWASSADLGRFAPRRRSSCPRERHSSRRSATSRFARGPARLVAWTERRFAASRWRSGERGPTVAGVRPWRSAPLVGSEDVLIGLGMIRRWPALLLGIVGDPPLQVGGVRESVQRIGFRFARLDDEGLEDEGQSGGPSLERELPSWQVASALVSLGLPASAQALLSRLEREGAAGAEEAMLLAYLLADRNARQTPQPSSAPRACALP
jgi:hypothetical protein